jgi:hypothetical protein
MEHNEFKDINRKNHVQNNIKQDFIISIRQWEYKKKIEKFSDNLNKIR